MKGLDAVDPRDIRVVPVARLDLTYAPRPWRFAHERRAEIDAHFADLRREIPELWNGQVLLQHHCGIEIDVFRGAYLQTDFASFLAWRDWNFPDSEVHNCFAMGALRGSDGGFILGCMAAHTANAGRVYFPCGTPDPSDIVGGRVDLAASVARELLEETGLGADVFTPQPGWTTVFAGPRIAQIRMLQARQPAAELQARILDHLAQEPQPELTDIHLVCSPADFDSRMPPFVTAYLEHIWAVE